MFAALPDFLGFKGRTLVLVHREELAEQAAEKLRKWNPTRTVGVEMGGRRSNGEQLVVASVQTIGKVGSKRLLQFNPAEFDAVVTDECQHSTAQSYRTIYQHFRVMEDKHRLSLGVTATVNRADGKGLGEVFQEIVYSKGICECIKEGWLADIKAFRIKTDTSLDGVGNVGGDFNLGELGTTVNTAAMNRLVVKSWDQHSQGRQTVVFAIDIQHSKDLAAAFQQQGHNFLPIWGDDPDRKDKMTLFRSGVVKGLVNCQLKLQKV